MVSSPNFNDGTWTVASTKNIVGDPVGDILWQNVGDQRLILWEQSGTTTLSVSNLPSLNGYETALVGDFDGDGLGDVLIRDGSAGSNQILLSSTGALTGTSSPVASWVPTATLDLTDDARDDIVHFNTSNFNIATWSMSGASVSGATSFASGYGAGDELLTAFRPVDLDSFSALWRDGATGDFDITQYINGANSTVDTFTVASGRDFLDSGDLSGDGNEDFVFRDNEGFGLGSIEVVFTDDNGLEGNRLEYNADFFFSVDFINIGDFDGDGRAELVSRDAESDELSFYNVIGSDQFSREIVGGDDADLIDGREGNDSVFGLGGNDILLGDDGRDWLFTGAGDDRANGGNGDDSLIGDIGDDTLQGGSGNDMISGGPGVDTLEAGNGTDFLFGDDGDDYLVGGAFGFDHLRGGEGNDLLRGGSDRGISEGGPGNDVMIGSSSNDVMFGGFGEDFIVGGLSQDTIFGGSGDDIIVGVDVAGTSGTDDTLFGGSGSDYFYLGSDDGNFYTGSGEAHIEDFSTSTTAGDWLVLNGTASNYTFFDAGSTIQVQQSSDSNIIAIIDTTASTAAVSAKAIYIG